MQTGNDLIGIAKQSAKDALAAAPTFAHGLTGGGIAIEVTQEADELTSAYLSPASANRSQVDASASIPTRVWTKSAGLYLLSALGDIVTTGSGTFQHVITLGDALPYLSVFEKKDGSILAICNAKVDELELAWEGNKPLDLTASLVAGVLSFPGTFVPTTDESETDDYFTPVGGTFKVTVSGGSPVATPVTGGKVNIKRTAEAKFYSGDIEAGNVEEGRCDVEVGLNLEPDDLTMWRTIVTGSAAGAGVSDSPIYGSLELDFAHGTDSLKVECAKVAFLADLPEADPAGGAAEVELSGIAYRVAGTPITFTLTNGQASY